jgi:hypothetical protein
MMRKQTDRLNFYGSVTHVHGHRLFNLNAVKLETWIYMHKNKGHNYYYSTSERQSSYNQNNFIILMKLRSAAEIYDASAAVLTKGLLNFKPAG